MSHSITIDPKTQTYVCPVADCHQSFPNRAKCVLHYKSAHLLERNYFCDFPECHKRFKNRKGLSSHSLVHSDYRPFLCSVDGCDYRAKSRSNLANHMDIHSEGKPFKCNECEKTFKTQNAINIHYNIEHSTQPAFRCRFEGCAQVFRKPSELDRHKKYEHNHRKKAVRCDWPGCEFQSNIASRILDHKALHTGVKRHVCQWDGCGKRFRSVGGKYKHTLIHKNEKRYACDWPGCEYRGNTSVDLYQHKRVMHK